MSCKMILSVASLAVGCCFFPLSLARGLHVGYAGLLLLLLLFSALGGKLEGTDSRSQAAQSSFFFTGQAAG